MKNKSWSGNWTRSLRTLLQPMHSSLVRENQFPFSSVFEQLFAPISEPLMLTFWPVFRSRTAPVIVAVTLGSSTFAASSSRDWRFSLGAYFASWSWNTKPTINSYTLLGRFPWLWPFSFCFLSRPMTARTSTQCWTRVLRPHSWNQVLSTTRMTTAPRWSMSPRAGLSCPLTKWSTSLELLAWPHSTTAPWAGVPCPGVDIPPWRSRTNLVTVTDSIRMNPDEIRSGVFGLKRPIARRRAAPRRPPLPVGVSTPI